MKPHLRLGLILALYPLVIWGQELAPGASLDVAPVWSGHPVHFAIETAGERQYVAYYDAERSMTVAARDLSSPSWRFTRLGQKLGWDSHNYVTLAVDELGYLHVSGNMHSSPLVYFRSVRPHDISSFEALAMTGDLEERVTYPRFLRGPDGGLVFHYRAGKSGDGVHVFNRYDVASRSWSRLMDAPLFDGRGRASSYLSGPVAGPDGMFHLVWMWRESPSGNHNRDISYARSPDLARWQTAGGEPLELPLGPDDRRPVVEAVATGSGLAGIAFHVGFDALHRPVVNYSRYDESGASQVYLARWEETSWRVRQVSRWGYRWELDRTGTLAEDVVSRPVSVVAAGRLRQEFEHVHEGEGIWLLDAATFEPLETRETGKPAHLERVESTFPGMEVRDFVYDRSGEYFLRWETLPVRRDRKLRGKRPPPTKLRVHRRLAERPAPPTSEEAAPPTTPGVVVCDAALIGGEPRVGRVDIEVGDVFADSTTQSLSFLYETMDRLHVDTREDVVRRDLLFGEGDSFDERLLAESERLLRSRKYLYDAEIAPVACRDGAIDVEVRTRDVWTIDGGAKFGRSGGENETRFEIQDSNFLGRGWDLGIENSHGVERESTRLIYRVPNLRSSRVNLEALVADNSDGDRHLLKLIRPFYSLDARWTAGLVVIADDRVTPFFDLGERVGEFRHRSDFLELFGGRSAGVRNGKLWRFRVGYAFDRHVFTAAGADGDIGVPSDRTLSYTWVGVDYQEDRFLEVSNLEQLDRVEDVQLGRRLASRVGFSSEALGADEDLFLWTVEAGLGFEPGKKALVLADVDAGARFRGDDVTTLLANARAGLFWRNWGRHLLHVDLSATYARNLDDERQLLLGGDSGLRGYPLRYQAGDRRLLFTVEQRFFTDWELLDLGYLGGAIFFDAGKAWFAGSAGAADAGDLGVLKDVGFGLRFASSRSARGSVLHLDVAFPLDRETGIESLQWLVSTKKSL